MDVNDNAGCLNTRVILAFFASELAPTKNDRLLAMDVNDKVGCLTARVVMAFFASMLAPTGAQAIQPGETDSAVS